VGATLVGIKSLPPFKNIHHTYKNDGVSRSKIALAIFIAIAKEAVKVLSFWSAKPRFYTPEYL
jgi:hypothetical protein